MTKENIAYIYLDKNIIMIPAEMKDASLRVSSLGEELSRQYQHFKMDEIIFIKKEGE